MKTERKRIPSALIFSAGLVAVSACGEPAEEQTRNTVEPTLNEVERQIQQIVQSNNAEAVDFLERVVNVNSGTLNSEGVREVGALFGEKLEAIGLTTDWIEMPPEIERGGHLFATHSGSA